MEFKDWFSNKEEALRIFDRKYDLWFKWGGYVVTFIPLIYGLWGIVNGEWLSISGVLIITAAILAACIHNRRNIAAKFISAIGFVARILSPCANRPVSQ